MDFLDKYINLKYFLISFVIGLLIVYITVPTPEIIIKYPTPQNAGKITYKDSSDTCYVYDAQEISCPQKTFDTPLQIINNKDKNNKGALTNLIEKISNSK